MLTRAVVIIKNIYKLPNSCLITIIIKKTTSGIYNKENVVKYLYFNHCKLAWSIYGDEAANCYTTSEKLHIIQFAEEHGDQAAQRVFGMPTCCQIKLSAKLARKLWRFGQIEMNRTA